MSRVSGKNWSLRFLSYYLKVQVPSSTLRNPVGSDLIMSRYQQKVQHILYSHAKRRKGPTNSFLGMTPTKILKDMFLWHMTQIYPKKDL